MEQVVNVARKSCNSRANVRNPSLLKVIKSRKQFFQETNEKWKKNILRAPRIFFFRFSFVFLEELRIPKIAFEIY